MNELRLAAVGSSNLVAEEIATILHTFLPDLPVCTMTTQEITTAEKNTLYICANTQGDKLKGKIPAKQLYIFHLEPTTVFFLALAKIPAGETVYIFNNLLPYAELLQKRCEVMGLASLHFVPLAYEEMDEAVLKDSLQQARYIIGVDIFVGENVLQKVPYARYLRKDVKILAGSRTASVASANQLLAGMADYYYGWEKEKLAEIKARHTAQDVALSTQDCKEWLERIQKRKAMLQQGVLHSVMIQIGLQGNQEEKAKKMPLKLTGTAAEDFLYMQDELQAFDSLRKKIHTLAKG